MGCSVPKAAQVQLGHLPSKHCCTIILPRGNANHEKIWNTQRASTETSTVLLLIGKGQFDLKMTMKEVLQ